MQTAELALVVSGISLLVSFGGLIWNVWSKFIFPKAKVRVTASVQEIVAEGQKVGNPFVTMSAINYGPGDIFIHLPIAEGPRDWRLRKENMLLRPLKLQPGGTFDIAKFDISFQRKLAVGESVSIHFPLPFTVMTKKRAAVRLGFVDTFNRRHWVPKKETALLRDLCLAAEAAINQARRERASQTGSGSPLRTPGA